jgi:uncharacterized protein
MKKGLIYFYQFLESVKHQILISVFGYHSVCKHRPTCSYYTMKAIKDDGTIVGLYKGIKRILSCW